ncbi:MAG: 2-dehydropantoate 2-reductase [Cyclobacteriaceae bacterium]|nr:MAG: 2-dehydropantoate 2-reductase [Cyclobacteriaceae bacterium]
MKIAIIGSGAVGGYFGAKLAKSGFEVKFLARGKQLEAMQSQGLKVKSISGNFVVKPVVVTDQIRELGQPDLILLGVKAWQLEEVRHQLIDIVNSNTAVLPLQNGVLAAEELGKSLNKKIILGGVCRIISKIESPGVINHFGAIPTIIFGSFDHRKSDLLSQIKSVFDRVGIDSRISEDIDSDIWKKFGFICVGGLMAVTGSTIGEMRTFDETRSLITSLVSEVCVLAEKAGINMGIDFVDQTLSFIDKLPEDTTFSMARDIWEKRPSELDYLNGTVVKLSQRYGIESPVNQFIYSVLKIKEIKVRSKD